MKKLIITYLTVALFPAFSFASIQEINTQKCIVGKVIEQIPGLAETKPSYAGVFLSTESTWDAIFLTQLENTTGRFFISVKDSDYENAQFWSDGVFIKVDLDQCF